MTIVARSSGSVVVIGVSTPPGRETVASNVWLDSTEVGEVGSLVVSPVLSPLGVVPPVGVPLLVGTVVGTSVTDGPPGRVTV